MQAGPMQQVPYPPPTWLPNSVAINGLYRPPSLTCRNVNILYQEVYSFIDHTQCDRSLTDIQPLLQVTQRDIGLDGRLKWHAAYSDASDATCV